MNKKGLTLVELIVTVVITGLIITAGIMISLNNQQIFRKDSVYINTRANTRASLEIITDDLRLAGLNPMETTAFNSGIVDAYANSITIRMDLNENGLYEVGEECSYDVSGGTFYKYISGGDSSAIADSIVYLEFSYLRANGTEFTMPVVSPQIDSIHSVKVIIIGKSIQPLFRYLESGTYPDGTPYSDGHYRCVDSMTVGLRNI